MAASDLDTVIVKVTADIDEFRSEMKSAAGDLDDFAKKGKEASTSTGSLTRETSSGASAARSYGASLQAAYGITDSLTRSQVSVIRSLEQQGAAAKMTGQEYAVYSALQRARTSADSEAGRVIATLALNTYGLRGAMAGAAGEIEHNATLSRTLRDALHTMAPAAVAAGVPIHELGGFAMAARGGLIGLAVALGATVDVALEKAADRARILKGRLTDLLGAGAGGIASAALDSSNIQGLATAYEELATARRKADDAFGIRRVGGDASNIREDTQALRAFSEALQLNGQTASAANNSVTAFIGAMAAIDQKTGREAGLTLDLFQKIEAQAPGAARAIAQALGAGAGPEGLENLERQLSRSSVSIDEFIRQLSQAAPRIDKVFAERPPTLEQSFDKAGESFSRFMEKLGESSGFHIAHDSASALSDTFDFLGQHADVVSQTIHAAIIAMYPPAASADIIADLKKLADGFGIVESAAQTAASAVAGSVQSIVQSVLNAIARMRAAQGDPSVPGVGMVPGQDISFDAGNLDSYATGGSFQVGGAGGTDSQLVRFMATPGETVTIAPPGSIVNDPHRRLSANVARPSVAQSSDGAVQTLGGQTISIAQSLARLNSAISSTAQLAAVSSGSLISSMQSISSVQIANGGHAVPWKGWQEVDPNSGPNPNAQDSSAPSPPMRIAALSPPTIAQPSKQISGPVIPRESALSGLGAYTNDIFTPQDGYNPDAFTPDYGNSNAFMPDYGNPNIFQSDSAYAPQPYNDYGYSGPYSSASDYWSGSDWMFDPASYGGAYGDNGGFDDYGYYARGGSFRVPGTGGTDSVKALMHVTPGEQVSVAPPQGQKIGAKDKSGEMHFHFYAPTDAQSFVKSRAQVRRAMRLSA